MKWRVSGDWRGEFSTYERALRRACQLRDKLKKSFDVLEIDDEGNETPVAHVGWPKPNTGRLSSNEPNFQNIPIRTAEGRAIREAFLRRKEH